jgi:hypothetical protein
MVLMTELRSKRAARSLDKYKWNEFAAMAGLRGWPDVYDRMVDEVRPDERY